MNDTLKLCLRTISSDVESNVAHGKVSGRPFVDFSSNAAEIFSGFSVLIEKIQLSLMEVDDDDHDSSPTLNRYERDAVLRMMQATSQIMTIQSCDLATWAEKRIKGDNNG